MLKYIAIVLVAATAAQADPSSRKDIDEALKREQRIQELSAPPRSVSNISGVDSCPSPDGGDILRIARGPARVIPSPPGAAAPCAPPPRDLQFAANC